MLFILSPIHFLPILIPILSYRYRDYTNSFAKRWFILLPATYQAHHLEDYWARYHFWRPILFFMKIWMILLLGQFQRHPRMQDSNYSYRCSRLMLERNLSLLYSRQYCLILSFQIWIFLWHSWVKSLFRWVHLNLVFILKNMIQF